MFSQLELLRKVPNFPCYTPATFGYPERILNQGDNSVIVFGPPLYMYDSYPMKKCTVHVSGIPDWGTMADVIDVFEPFGKLYSIELSVKLEPIKFAGAGKSNDKPPVCNGSALVTFVNYEGAQKALGEHLTLRIPGMVMPLSIYPGIVSEVVLLKNIPATLDRSDVLQRINGYPGVMKISFPGPTTARMEFANLDLALLFMDIVSGGGLKMEGFTCCVQPENKEEMDDDDEVIIQENKTDIEFSNAGLANHLINSFNPNGLLMPAPSIVNSVATGIFGENMFPTFGHVLNAN